MGGDKSHQSEGGEKGEEAHFVGDLFCDRENRNEIWAFEENRREKSGIEVERNGTSDSQIIETDKSETNGDGEVAGTEAVQMQMRLRD